jgi:glycosyltransferase involved in cell wall biosynthesis
MKMPIITVQLCTYNRRALLGRVMAALFAQDLDPDDYEIVLVDDGSTDGTYESVIGTLRPTCALTVVRQRNAGLARGRNAGIARARGEFIMFMDDDVLATPGLLSAHLRCHRAHARAICRGAVINVASFDELPPARYTWRNYSGAYFGRRTCRCRCGCCARQAASTNASGSTAGKTSTLASGCATWACRRSSPKTR